MITVTSVEAQGRLPELLQGLEKEGVVILEEGAPTAFLISASELDELVEARRRNQAVARWEEWKMKAKEHLTPAAAELTDEDINRLVHELR